MSIGWGWGIGGWESANAIDLAGGVWSSACILDASSWPSELVNSDFDKMTLQQSVSLTDMNSNDFLNIF